MPRQNRVLPTGEIAALPLRGLFMGNRGILHDTMGRLGTARWRHPHWVCCTLSFKDRHRTVMSPGTWTELFFLDEAVALAAGHRPCAECRRADHLRFRAAWAAAIGPASAPDIDRALHAARVTRTRAQVRHRADIATLPAGTFIATDSGPALVTANALHPFIATGYAPPVPRPTGQVTVLTPAPTVAVLRAGYIPALHPDVISPP
jgi:hypothetical protein